MKGNKNDETLKGSSFRVFSGGEGGIRTRGPFQDTRSPSERIRPDYATSPNFPQGDEIIPSEFGSDRLRYGCEDRFHCSG